MIKVSKSQQIKGQNVLEWFWYVRKVFDSHTKTIFWVVSFYFVSIKSDNLSFSSVYYILSTQLAWEYHQAIEININ